jgi:hypothetical protein
MDHLMPEERLFREKQALIQGEEALVLYYSMDDGMMAVRLRDKGVGLMTWVSRDMAMDRLGIVKMGPEEGRVAREWALLEMIREEDMKFTIKRGLVQQLMDLEREIVEGKRSSLFQSMGSMGIEPVCFARSHHGLGEVIKGVNTVNWECLVWLPGIEGVKVMEGRKRTVQAAARTAMLDALYYKMVKMDRSEVEDWIDTVRGELGKWRKESGVDKGKEVVWYNVDGVPEYIALKSDVGGKGIEGTGWFLFDEMGKRTKSVAGKEKDKEMWESKLKGMSDIMIFVNGGRTSEIGDELWVISEESWVDLWKVVTDRFRELFNVAPWMAVDSEGGGATLQLSVWSSMGVASFVFVRGFMPASIRSLIWNVCPTILGNKSELCRYLGSTGGCVQIDPMVIFRDVPGVGTEYGLKVLAKVMLGCDVSRIKELAGLHASSKFETMTLTELRFGNTRVSNWTSNKLTAEQAWYATLDTEILIRTTMVGVWLECVLRTFKQLPKSMNMETILEWWDWAKDFYVDSATLQQAKSTAQGKTKNPGSKVLDGTNHFFTHHRGQRFSRMCDPEELVGWNEMIEKGEIYRRNVLVDRNGCRRSDTWWWLDRKRRAEIQRRLRH